MAEIFAIDVDENISDSMWQQLLNAISKNKREEIKRFHYEKDAKRALYADVLVRYLICNKLNMNNSDICFIKNQYGKPYLDGVSDAYFNISHAGQYVMCGWSQQEIGIDVEVVKNIDMDIAKRFFTKEEYEYIITKTAKEQSQYFFDFWTLKESYIKYKGKGLTIPLNTFGFKLNKELVELQSIDKELPRFYRFNLDKNHKLAVCTNDDYITGVSFVSLQVICNCL